MSDENLSEERRIVGYLCGYYPDGPMIPPASYDGRPCDRGDRAVWSDGTMTDA